MAEHYQIKSFDDRDRGKIGIEVLIRNRVIQYKTSIRLGKKILIGR
jgi:hypothetical protein